MNLKKAKRLRRFIKDYLKLCSPEPLYTEWPDGSRRLADECQRAHYQRTKRFVKKSKLEFNLR